MARRKAVRRKLTQPTRWNVYNAERVQLGVIDLHPSEDVANRYLARMVSHYGTGTLGTESAAYKTLWGASRAIVMRADKLGWNG